MGVLPVPTNSNCHSAYLLEFSCSCSSIVSWFLKLLINYDRLTYWYINKIWCVCLTNIKIFWWLLATKRVWFAIFYYISFWDNRATTVITFLFSVKIIFVTSATELITRWIFSVYIVLNIKSFISLEADKNSNNLNE